VDTAGPAGVENLHMSQTTAKDYERALRIAMGCHGEVKTTYKHPETEATISRTNKVVRPYNPDDVAEGFAGIMGAFKGRVATYTYAVKGNGKAAETIPASGTRIAELIGRFEGVALPEDAAKEAMDAALVPPAEPAPAQEGATVDASAQAPEPVNRTRRSRRTPEVTNGMPSAEATPPA
jgi:hypothetical protein